MVVGVCRVAFSLPGNASLKGKRSVVRRIVDRTRAKFNAAVAEVADLDSHRRAVIGVSVVSNDTRHANSMLDHISVRPAPGPGDPTNPAAHRASRAGCSPS
jgi:uncharacterized protein YlxP (DUF503 family)